MMSLYLDYGILFPNFASFEKIFEKCTKNYNLLLSESTLKETYYMSIDEIIIFI
jgi:hypothetical protein